MSIAIQSLDDPRVAAYRNLKDKELDRAGRLFIAESDYIVRRLLESDYPVESVLVSQRREAEIAPLLPQNVPLYVVSEDVMRGVMGMSIHTGVIACGRRKPWPRLEEVIPKNAKRLTLMICPDTNNVMNIGALIRISAALGANALLMGERCHDPFWRQSIRVSMGSVFRLPLYRATDMESDLYRLKREWNVEMVGSVLDADAEPLESAMRQTRLGILVGNEADGLSPQYAKACDRRITIPMKLGTDSLNVAIAAGIFLYHFGREESFRGE